MPETKQLTGLKKRQQIVNANKMIFVWVIVASVALAFCGVTMQFLARQALFNQRIIGAKLEAQSVLSRNLDNVSKLKANVDKLQADPRLALVKANPEDTNLKVVLDALPTSDDRTALGASLQQVILPKSGVHTADLTTISPNSIVSANSTSSTGSSSSGVSEADFTFAASGDYTRIKTMLNDLERSIRPINVKKLSLQSNDGQIKATVVGVSYYSPSQTVQVGKKTLKP